LNTFENVHLKCTPGHLPFQISKYASDDDDDADDENGKINEKNRTKVNLKQNTDLLLEAFKPDDEVRDAVMR